MDKVIEIAKELEAEIKDLPEVQEYLRLKELYENDEDLKKMRVEIARLEYEGKEEEKKNLIEIYNSNPLVNNFNLAKEETKQILQNVKEILSE